MTEADSTCDGRSAPCMKPKEDTMCDGGGAFGREEVEYLRSLPAVAEATSRRITYSEDFKRACMRRYRNGESPVKMFREAGLDPALIGYKRIERCFARWRKSEEKWVEDDRTDAPTIEVDTDGEPCSHCVKAVEMLDSMAVSSPVSASVPPPVREADVASKRSAAGNVIREVPAAGQRDTRDLLIYQQVRRIDELERQVNALLAELDDNE